MDYQQDARDKARVMLAFAEGERIEWCAMGSESWSRVIEPAWNWSTCKYRLVEGGSRNEVVDKVKELGPWIRNNHSGVLYQVLAVSGDGVKTSASASWILFSTFNLDYTFEGR